MPNQNHLKNVTNNIDPDDGISWLCAACKLPIFATPFSGSAAASLHDQCAKLPAVLPDCELHPQQPLLLRDNISDETCSECSQKCGSKLYYCQDTGCGLVLDVACALPVKILHRSHRHRLLAVRGANDGRCGICGIAHKAAAEAEARSYLCSVCGFWIHPECATSANVIEHEKHVHPLVLYYDIGAAFGAQLSTPLDLENFLSYERESDSSCSICAICGNGVGKGVGVFACITCRDSVFHVSCATSDRRSFKPVLSREAQFPNFARLPLADEHQSILREVTSKSDGVQQNLIEIIHTTAVGREHVFITHDDHLKTYEEAPVCDACLKIITIPPFYGCSACPDMFVHDYCYRIPPLLSGHPAHTPGHKFLFFLFSDTRPYGSPCVHCRCMHVRSCYTCTECLERGTMDASCALMPGVVTHEAHGTAHFLRLSEGSSRRSQDDPDCACCLRPLGALAYECRTCENFNIHTWCAMLPRKVNHKFDTHPLRLTTTACVADICEICERGIEERVWRYNCESCDRSFHVDCIPSLDLNYKIKSLVSLGQIRKGYAPKRLIRGLTLEGHGHVQYCRDVADEYDDVWESV